MSIVRRQDFACLSGSSEARGQIHRVTGYGVLAVAGTPGPAGNNLSTSDADMNADGMANPRRHLRHRCTNSQRRASGSFGVVAMSNRGTEDAHDAIADVLVDPSALLLNDAVGAVEELLE